MLTHLWHTLLGMQKHDLAWHKKDLADEYLEYEEARRPMEKWSELSDVVYTYTRAKWSGHTRIPRPVGRLPFLLGHLYMFPKYSLRWLFFVSLGKSLKSPTLVRCVRNPKKTHKLHALADEFHLDRKAVEKLAKKRLRYWPLLP